MIPIRKVERRRFLRGMLGGAAISVGLPYLDCFLNNNGDALANGQALPNCFGTWFQGLGFAEGFWEPKIIGANYEFGPHLQALTPWRDKINIFTGMKVFLDGHPLQVHRPGPQVSFQGGIPNGPEQPSIDQLVADVIGTRTRYRSIEVSCHNSTASFSRRSAASINPSEPSPVALYTRIFGPDFQDPNSAEFTPDPDVMVRRSVLSMVADERATLTKSLGASDRARMDEYFTSLRELEQQLELQLQKPAPLAACTVPGKPDEIQVGTVVDQALQTNKLFSGLLAHALACGQTNVINVEFGGTASDLRQPGNPQTFHIYSHEEAIDPKLGYQPVVAWFQQQCMDGFATTLKVLDSIKEGDGTLLDRTLLYYSTDHGVARVHGLDNMPMMTAGRVGKRLKTGMHLRATGDTVTRVGLTIQQAFGVPVSAWGSESNRTSKPFTELLA